MARIFISSTYEDLHMYREAAVQALRPLGHDVIVIEHHGATDQQPRERSLTDIAISDLYVGIFGWRYGYIPPEDNPEALSVTEIEYRHASRLGKPTLIFMVNEAAPWPPSWIDDDSDGRIRAFRTELSRQRLVGFFDSVDDFVTQLVQAVATWEERELGKRSAVPGSLEHLPLAWRLVVDFKAEPDLLRHMDPSAFVTALEKWEEENRADRNLPLATRLETALKRLEAKQPGHKPSELWLAWMRATRPVATEPTGPGHAANEA